LFFIGKGGPTDGFNIAITPRTETLVVRGPYRYTRNPMVFGALSIYFSISLFFLSILCLLTMTIFSILIVFYLRKTEERRLLKDFGDEYIRYKKEVPMIFPKFHN
jgi:protein-S-isoprenylcysteine O-methyltransferase Ste14